MNRFLLLAALAATPCAVQAAAPNINVGAMFEYLDPGQGNLLKRVRNSGDATAFVRVEITEVVYPADGGAPVERPVDTQPLAANAVVDGHRLIASPARLIVAAKGQQATRLLSLGTLDHERYYRVRFVPVLPESASEFALSPEEAAEYSAQVVGGVQVLTGYGVFVIARPQQVRYATALDDGASHYTVRNDGNATVIIDGYQSCASDEQDCAPPQKFHVLPQRSQQFDKTAGQHHRFELIEGDQQRPIRFGS